MNIQTILVPVDYSACSWEVAEAAGSLAAKLGAAVAVLHVGELPRGMTRGTLIRHDGVETSAADWVRADAAARLAPLVEAVRAHGVVANAVVEVGAVVPTILAVAEAGKADLIVMGTHGREGLARVVLGSVAEGVAHQAHVPVMLIRREPKPACARKSCAWCAGGGTAGAEELLAVEAEG